VPASSILLLDGDPSSDGVIATVLTDAGYTVTTTTDPAEALAKAADYQLVILDRLVGDRRTVDVCRDIRGTPTMSGIPVLCVATTDKVDERIEFLQAGADDVMARPFDARELEARIEALLLRFQRSKDLTSTSVVSSDGVTVSRMRRTVAVYSPKGGVGTTTIATNVAVVGAVKRPDKVVLLDLSLQFGGVASHLNLEPKQTIADAVRDEAALREPEILRTYAIRHDSGLHVLAAPGTPEGADLVTPKHVERIIANLLEGYDSVVVDTGSVLDERSMLALDAAETVILPVYPEISALRAVHNLLEYFNDVGSIGERSTFVLNNMFAREILKLRDIESALGTKIALDLPYDPFLYLKAVNEGIPVVLGAPKSAAAERLTKLSVTAFGEEGFVVPDSEGGKKGRFGRRR
jgi:pilus assembly protein CpaE